MELLVGSKQPHIFDGVHHGPEENGSSNSNANASPFEFCFLCNRRFLQENVQNLDTRATEDFKDEDILGAFFEEFGSFEKSLLRCCQACKSSCKNLMQAKNSLSSLIDEISSLLRRSNKISGYVLPKPRVLSRLFQHSPPQSSSSSVNHIETDFATEEDANLVIAFSMSTTDYSTFPERFQLTLVDHQASSSSAKEVIESISPVTIDEKLLSHNAGSFIPNKSLPTSVTSGSQSAAAGSLEQRITEQNADNFTDGDVGNVDESALIDHQDDKGANSSLDEPPHVSKYLCDICDKPFKYPRDLENHIGYHRQDKPYICEICGVSYRQKRGLESHVALHKGEALFKCDHCNKSFTQKSGLQRHLPIHSGETVFQCDICGKGFMYHSSFAHHKRIHSGERNYSCEFCDQSFLSSSHLKRHNKIHTGEKAFKCDVCQKAFISNANLKAHRRVHTGMPAHSCPHCDHGFDKKHKMMKHVVDVHPEVACDVDS